MTNPPIDKPDDFNYNTYIQTADWSGITYIKSSPMLSFMRRVKDWIPNELHRTSIKEAIQKMNYDGDRLARTSHAQVLGIMRRHMKPILEKGQSLMDVASYNHFEKEFKEGIALAEKLEDECRRRAEERQKKSSEGNIVWKVKEKPSAEKVG